MNPTDRTAPPAGASPPRRRTLRWITAGLFLAVPMASAGGCATLAGIDERRLGPCGDYCDAVMDTCRGQYSVYSSYDTCFGVCMLLDPGDPLEPSGSNSVACRQAEAKLAALGEPGVHCPRSGPAGGGSCGQGACESYCLLYERACGEEWDAFKDTPACMKACDALRDTGEFDAIQDASGDTLQCRLVHVSSATVEPDEHCSHARLAPPTPPCADPDADAPSCSDYCRVVMAACDGDRAQYESMDQCLGVCDALDPGTNADQIENTVGCREYHAYNSLLDPDTHCPHAGPTGDGHCGAVNDQEQSLCETYCSLVNQACPEGYSSAFLDPADCESSCAHLSDSSPESHYNVAAGALGGDTLACRMLYAARALDDDSSCAAAVGEGAPCTP